MNILFLCKGNVGRSQIAEVYFNDLFPKKGHAYSAGTQLSGPEQSLESLRPGTDPVIDVMKEEGYDVCNNIRRQLTDEMLVDGKADKIILITTESTPGNITDDRRLVCWDITDPKGMSLNDTRIIRNKIKEKVIALGNLI